MASGYSMTMMSPLRGSFLAPGLLLLLAAAALSNGRFAGRPTRAA